MKVCRSADFFLFVAFFPDFGTKDVQYQSKNTNGQHLPKLSQNDTHLARFGTDCTLLINLTFQGFVRVLFGSPSGRLRKNGIFSEQLPNKAQIEP